MVDKMRVMIEKLNAASDAYYNTGDTLMTDKEFDALLAELKKLEEESGVVLSNSPTQNVGAPVLTKLNKITHEYKPMLSLEKVHHASEIIEFAKRKWLVSMVKLDGLSVRLTYENGRLVRGETRGNGIEGSDITEHVKQFENVPLVINKKGVYVVDGEAIISNRDFDVDVYRDYHSFCSINTPEQLLGTVRYFESNYNGRTYANLFAQKSYGYDGKQYTDINALRKCFENLRLFCSFENLSIAMPYKIGCVRGGANWDEVYAIIEEVFKDCNVELWRLDKG